MISYRTRQVVAPIPTLLALAPIIDGCRCVWIGGWGAGGVYRWDVDRNEIDFVVSGIETGNAIHTVVSPNNRYAAIVSLHTRRGAVVDLASNAVVRELAPTARGHIDAIAFFERDGRTYLVDDGDALSIVDVDANCFVSTLDERHDDPTISPNGKTIAMRSDRGTATWSIDAWLADASTPSTAAIVSTDFGQLVWIDDDHLGIYEAGLLRIVGPTPREVRIFEPREYVPSAEIAVDGDVVHVRLEGELATVDLATSQRLATRDDEGSGAYYHPGARQFVEHPWRDNPTKIISFVRDEYPTVRELAASLARDRLQSELPILGDALQLAGCTDRAILDHCANPGAHAGRCWVLDRLGLPRE